MSLGIKFNGVDKWRDALKSGPMRTAIGRHVERATMLNAKRASAIQRRIIQTSNGLEKNADLTIALKGEDKPLVGDSTLFGAITEFKSGSGLDVEVFSGILRTEGRYNIGVVVHNGMTINVTPKMRGLFFYLWKASEAAKGNGKMPVLTGRAEKLFQKWKDWMPLSASTSVIVIPGRPWVEKAFADPGLRREAQRNWTQAIQDAMREVAGQ